MNLTNQTDLFISFLLTGDVKLLSYLYQTSTSNSFTDEVRKKIDTFSITEKQTIQKNLTQLLCSLYALEDNHYSDAITNLTSQELLLTKEAVIYYIGRIEGSFITASDLYRIYEQETNFHLRMNLAFTACLLGFDNIELDFVHRLLPGSKEDLLLRSWTLAFFSNTINPYEYRDTPVTDWTLAKTPRIKRLQNNELDHPKFAKSMHFRLFDLTVLNLFVVSRKSHNFTPEELTIIKDCCITSSYYSAEKQQMLKQMKHTLLENIERYSK